MFKKKDVSNAHNQLQIAQADLRRQVPKPELVYKNLIETMRKQNGANAQKLLKDFIKSQAAKTALTEILETLKNIHQSLTVLMTLKIPDNLQNDLDTLYQIASKLPNEELKHAARKYEKIFPPKNHNVCVSDQISAFVENEPPSYEAIYSLLMQIKQENPDIPPTFIDSLIKSAPLPQCSTPPLDLVPPSPPQGPGPQSQVMYSIYPPTYYQPPPTNPASYVTYPNSPPPGYPPQSFGYPPAPVPFPYNPQFPPPPGSFDQQNPYT